MTHDHKTEKDIQISISLSSISDTILLRNYLLKKMLVQCQVKSAHLLTTTLIKMQTRSYLLSRRYKSLSKVGDVIFLIKLFPLT